MEDVTLAHAKEHLEELIERAARGDNVRIVDPKLGSVRLISEVPAAADREQPYPPRIAGQWKHIAEIPDERLFAPLSEDELAWMSGEQSGVRSGFRPFAKLDLDRDLPARDGADIGRCCRI